MPGKSNPDRLDQLMDIVCELPRKLDLATKVSFGGQSGDSEATAAVIALWSILRDIYDWQMSLYAASRTPLYTAVPSKLINPSDDIHDMKLFPFSLEFLSLEAATDFMMSWAFQLHIHIILQSLIEEMGEAVIVPSQFVDLHNSLSSVQREAEKLARLICQSIEYCHRIKMGTFGPQIMIYPQWVMRQFFARCGSERELQWCDNIRDMSGVGTRCGIKLMSFQGSIKCFKRARE